MTVRMGFRRCMLLCCTLLCITGTALTQEKKDEVHYQVIRLLSEKIVPSVATIQLGTVVIWVNEDSKPTEIKFTNASGMVISCDGSDTHIADPEKIISTLIPHAGLESLCLVQKGTFDYTVQRETGTLQGTIVVE